MPAAHDASSFLLARAVACWGACRELTIELAHAGEVLIDDLLCRPWQCRVRADAAWLLGGRAHVFPHLRRQTRTVSAQPPQRAVSVAPARG